MEGTGMEKQKYTAIVMAAGSGKRMNSKVHKQYLIIQDRPVLYYSLKAFEDSAVDEIVLVVGKGEEKFCRKEIVDKYGISKVKAIVEGGKERYHSVFEGLKQTSDADYVLIHDGARPFVNQDIIRRCMQEVQKYQACVVGMPVKDTIKIADEEGYAKQTPDRKNVWMIQTPQTFSYALIYEAYEEMLKTEDTAITDDAMVLERIKGKKSKLIEGSYRNIKITTPEDLLIANVYLQHPE
ncbi:2-C-methyl-D-erythritol 4-phosphate cytidylyltransferase [Roseburia inulinivorans]|jgi:2-C-methyl-D-erythritol 4-phosphate cytidylyltransferase|uniref:2-C-methyl-D-erythritol 4-phosphate cytidylyltransferase n=2 Tax=Roseburia inulinivorans TaxID=360807 RepID=A0A412BBF1_9FIRM|nr:2-C-methyl-D-erythritol 4-phosphate cytidylyltransferase [Roseburia inulinivorans]